MLFGFSLSAGGGAKDANICPPTRSPPPPGNRPRFADPTRGHGSRRNPLGGQCFPPWWGKGRPIFSVQSTKQKFIYTSKNETKVMGFCCLPTLNQPLGPCRSPFPSTSWSPLLAVWEGPPCGRRPRPAGPRCAGGRPDVRQGPHARQGPAGNPSTTTRDPGGVPVARNLLG